MVLPASSPYYLLMTFKLILLD